jgi:RES domain-containing protein
MVLWRISRHRDLSGAGGLKAGGRWHYPGQPVIYLSENPASALLEVCVHTSANDIPPDFTLLRVVGPDSDYRRIAPTELPADWHSRPEVTREIGTNWLRSDEGVLLQVPSAIVPWTVNCLFNPLHPGAQDFQIAETIDYPFDSRIKW